MLLKYLLIVFLVSWFHNLNKIDKLDDRIIAQELLIQYWSTAAIKLKKNCPKVLWIKDD